MSTRIGIDLGGTKIELVVLDAAGCERWRRRVATPQGDYAGTLHAIAALVDEAERVTGAGARVGIGTPGSPSPRDGRIRNANSTCLNGQALQQDLEALLRRPIRLANDANCLAMSEAADGAGAGARTVFAAILGTGVGGGIVVDGKLLVVEADQRGLLQAFLADWVAVLYCQRTARELRWQLDVDPLEV